MPKRCFRVGPIKRSGNIAVAPTAVHPGVPMRSSSSWDSFVMTFSMRPGFADADSVGCVGGCRCDASDPAIRPSTVVSGPDVIRDRAPGREAAGGAPVVVELRLQMRGEVFGDTSSHQRPNATMSCRDD